MRFEVYKQSMRTLLGAGEWRWRLVADNNETIAQGESYKDRASCLHAIKLLRSTTIMTPVIDQETKQPVFFL